MINKNLVLSVVTFQFMFFTGCNQKEVANKNVVVTEEDVLAKVTRVEESTHKEPHPYGGWFCPDNFGGFPPMDIQDFEKIQVVNNRLPTKEETRNGTSLIYIDVAEYPNAQPLDMTLPRVARIYSRHNDIDELIIVIQAVIIGEDTVVGFRYPNGGNGSAWFDQVTFLSNQEVDEIGPTPFVYFNSDIDASKEEVWKEFTQTAYAKELGEKFNEQEFFASNWISDSQLHLSYEADNIKATGIVSEMWGNIYIQIDYDYGSSYFSEKMLILENKEENKAQLHIVSGPYPKNIASERQTWKSWIQKIKDGCETI